jgi:TusA-related sulfurtransferase
MRATIARSLDLRGVPEGAQLATAAVAMLELGPGELLDVRSEAPDAPRDLAVWCRANGHRLIGHQQRDGVHRMVIQRRDGRSSMVFTEAELEGLPGPVRRHLAAAIAPGTPLVTSARLRMRGRIKVGRWLPFHAEETLDPHHGFTWTARASGLISGYDRYAGGQGQMRWKLLGVLPLMRADGPDVSRSAAGRAAAEAIWVPTALLPRFGVDWAAADERHVSARYRIDAVEVEVRYQLDAAGHVRSVVFDRWGDPDGTGVWGLHPFRGEITAYATFDGLSIPSAGNFGWFFGTDRWSQGEFFRYRITELRLLARHPIHR